MREPPDRAAAGVLFVSYTGMLEPLGQSQVVAYQEVLAADRPTAILSFERADDWAREDDRAALAARLDAAGIVWLPLRYHRRPPLFGTLFDIAAGIVAGRRLVRRHRLRILHARSYVPGAIALGLRALTGAAFVFDMRGFWADERVDGGLWKRDGILYRIAKAVERRLLRRADHIVSLTHAAAREIRTFPYMHDRAGTPITVIPTCADLRRFHPDAAAARDGFASRDDAGPPTVCYAGSVGTWYQFESVLAAFRHVLADRPGARLRILNRHDHARIRSLLATAAIPPEAVELRAAAHADMPALMAAADVGIFFYRPSYSRLACAPTKLGEFLGCGVPCLSNRGVGDMAQILETERVGVVVDDFSEASLRDGVRRLLALRSDPDVAARCVEAARRHFSLDGGVAGYRDVYRAVEGLVDGAAAGTG